MSSTLSSPSLLSVSQLTSLLKEHLEHEYRDLWVEGEISTLRVSPAGHYYFTLKDQSAQIKAVFFKGKARYFRRHLREGNQVTCHGDLSFYRERGEIQLMVDFLEPRGKGRDFLLLEFLKKRLAAEGLFNIEKKRPLPPLPRTIGVITSPQGAAIRDIIKVVRETGTRVRILLYPVTVQGEKAPQEVAQAIRELNLMGGIDVIILARGGGAKEDLAAFNTEEVARAVAASKVPLVSAVGHEIDTTLADLAADARAPTPSAAAHMVVAQAQKLGRHLAELKIRITRALATSLVIHGNHLHHLTQRMDKASPIRRIESEKTRLSELEKRLVAKTLGNLSAKREKLQGLAKRLTLQEPTRVLRDRRALLTGLQTRLSQAMSVQLNNKKQALAPLTKALEALSPLAILERGYSIALNEKGTPITSHAQVEIGERIEIILHRGTLLGTVTGKKKNR